MSEWRPIETAPRDAVLLYQPAVARGRNPHSGLPPRMIVGRAADQLVRQATHWMPLPEPPPGAHAMSADQKPAKQVYEGEAFSPARMRELLATAEDYEREGRTDALTYDGTLGLALLRTLAAREALLRRAEKLAKRIEVLEPVADEPVRLVGRHSIGFTIVPIGGRDMIAPEVWRAIDADARALAAEIAAALNQGENQ